MVSERTVNSSAAFSFVWYAWKIVGLVPPTSTYSSFKKIYYTYAICMNLAGSIASPVTIFINVFFINNVGLMLQNLQVSVPMLVSSLKHGAIYLNIQKLRNANLYLEKLDQRVSQSMDEISYINRKIQQCHKMFFIVTVSYCLTISVYSGQGYYKKQLPFEAWFPFDWRASIRNYRFAYWFQVLAWVFQLVQNNANDVYSVAYIHTINGHIHCLCLRISRIGQNPSTTVSENYDELVRCIEDHNNIIG